MESARHHDLETAAEHIAALIAIAQNIGSTAVEVKLRSIAAHLGVNVSEKRIELARK